LYNCLALLKFGSKSKSEPYLEDVVVSKKIPAVKPITAAIPIFMLFSFKKIKLEITA
jgi:hypothetical protein